MEENKGSVSQGGEGTAAMRRRGGRPWLAFVMGVLVALLVGGGVFLVREKLRGVAPVDEGRWVSRAKLVEKVPRAATEELLSDDARNFAKEERDTFLAMIEQLRAMAAHHPDMVALWEERRLCRRVRSDLGGLGAKGGRGGVPIIHCVY